VVTAVAASLVAICFGLTARGLGAVVAVNLVTNPVLFALGATLFGLGVGYTFYPYEGGYGSAAAAPWTWVVMGLMEAAIIVVEWRLLVWALAGRSGSSRKLLIMSIVMNVVSAGVASLVLSVMLGAPLVAPY
jgi:hypothetical protein